MRIPKGVNAALDWVGHNMRVLAVVATAVIVSLTLLWIPVLAGFVLGIAVGGVAVHQRMARQLSVSHADVDDLLRQNGALRREKIVAAEGAMTAQSQLTHKLPVIPEDDAGGD